MKPIIGLYYREQPTLRRMPPHWTLEESRQEPVQWLSMDAWVLVICVIVGAMLLVQAVLAVAR